MSANKDLATRCVLKWFELTPEMAREWFTEDAIYENKCDQGPTVVGPDEIYAILDAYRKMCERFEGKIVNIVEDGDVVMLEREELTFLKNGGVVNLPVMAAFSMRGGKIAAWREYWDLATLTKHLLEGDSGEAVTERYKGYQTEAAKRGTTSGPQNTRVLLVRRPRGEPTDDDFQIESQPIPPLADGEILIEIRWLSLDPYMRGRMSDRKSYAPPTELGQPVVGEAAGVVAASRSDRWNEGDTVCVRSGWQSYFVAKGDDPTLYRVDAKASPLSTYLGVLGMPGRTAYFGLLRIGKPQPGETVVVSAAAGAVGSAVGQIAKIRGCRAVGVAGGEAKCRHVVDELGFDACVDYKAGNLEGDLAAACPDGIDVYFENVGGAVARAVAPLLNRGARVPICGFISAYNSENMAKEETPFDVFGALADPPEHRFFLVFDFVEENDEANAQLAEWLRQGKLKYRESVVDGIENAPAAFRGLLHGKNLGKQLIAVAKG